MTYYVFDYIIKLFQPSLVRQLARKVPIMTLRRLLDYPRYQKRFVRPPYWSPLFVYPPIDVRYHWYYGVDNNPVICIDVDSQWLSSDGRWVDIAPLEIRKWLRQLPWISITGIIIHPYQLEIALKIDAISEVYDISEFADLVANYTLEQLYLYPAGIRGRKVAYSDD